MPLSASFSVAAATSETVLLVLGPVPPRTGMVDLSLSIGLTDAFADGRVLASIVPMSYQPKAAADALLVRPWASQLSLVSNNQSTVFSWRVPLGRDERFLAVVMPINNTLAAIYTGFATLAVVPGTVQAGSERRKVADGALIVAEVPRPGGGRSAT